MRAITGSFFISLDALLLGLKTFEEWTSWPMRPDPAYRHPNPEPTMTQTPTASARTTTARPPSGSLRLAAGVLSPALFLLVSFAQMPFNPGFDLTRHAFSYLSIGDTGPIQQTNFVVMGLLNLVAATALRSYLPGRLGTAAAVLLAVDGVGQVVAGIFTLDPSNGFPEGAPTGLPDTVSAHGNLHGLGFALSMVSWVLLLLVLARRHAKASERGWARASVGCAAALLGTAACLMTDFGTALLYVVLTAAWLFTGATFQHLRTHP
ncbi:MAG TPA: DUF998 domain-containing protein [Marmoricola sp.]|nr:DUF998 domain-containing protein [Marmoricola sp.]